MFCPNCAAQNNDQTTAREKSAVWVLPISTVTRCRCSDLVDSSMVTSASTRSLPLPVPYQFHQPNIFSSSSLI